MKSGKTMARESNAKRRRQMVGWLLKLAEAWLNHQIQYGKFFCWLSVKKELSE